MRPWTRPKSPRDALNCLQTEPGLRIELVAAEPLVMDPVAIAFDRRGRMFVVEYGDYPTGAEGDGPPLSRVVLLEDTDADGRSDRRHVFADRLTFAHSLMAWNGGILVGAQTEIVFLKDTTGDNRADLRQVLFQGFVPAHPQMQIGNPRWGFDNWIYLNYGTGQITSSKAAEKVVDMPRMDFRFHPVTHEFEADSGLGQFGNTVDNWGHRFFLHEPESDHDDCAETGRRATQSLPRHFQSVYRCGGVRRRNARLSIGRNA